MMTSIAHAIVATSSQRSGGGPMEAPDESPTTADHEPSRGEVSRPRRHAEDQRYADRHQRIGRAQISTVDHLLVSAVIAPPQRIPARTASDTTSISASLRALLRLRRPKRGIAGRDDRPVAAMSPGLIAA